MSLLVVSTLCRLFRSTSNATAVRCCIFDRLAVVLRQRLQLLSGVSSAWQSAQRLRFSSIMCVDVASRRLVEAAAERGRLGPGLFPEHR